MDGHNDLPRGGSPVKLWSGGVGRPGGPTGAKHRADQQNEAR
jgi:hypothetical protein